MENFLKPFAYANGVIRPNKKNNGRNISAPFQPEGPQTPKGSIDNFRRPDHQIDYLSVSFEELEVYETVSFEKYCGPTPESNWVIPGKLLVGAYPASQNDAETCDLLTSILKLGINKFVCLQAEYKDGVPEAAWRSGNALRPYFDDVKIILSNKHLIPHLENDPNVCDIDKVSFVHFPIKDCSITDDNRVLQLALSLVQDIHKGEVIYMHCWGGHGRTGTLVSIMLHLMYGLDSHASMDRCQFVHDLRQCPVDVGSPQTQPQRDQVIRVISHLQKEANRVKAKVRKARVSGDSTPRDAPLTKRLEKDDSGEFAYYANEPSEQSSAIDDLAPDAMSAIDININVPILDPLIPSNVVESHVTLTTSHMETNNVVITEQSCTMEWMISSDSGKENNNPCTASATVEVSKLSIDATQDENRKSEEIRGPTTQDISKSTSANAANFNPQPPTNFARSWKGGLKGMRCGFGNKTSVIDPSNPAFNSNGEVDTSISVNLN